MDGHFRKRLSGHLPPPDVAPLDYGIWDKVAGIACKDTAPNVETMKANVNVAWAAMDLGFVRCVCQGFWRRLEAIITAGGGRIE